MIPKSFQALGQICLIKQKDRKVAKEILEKHNQFKSVYYQGKITGQLRKPDIIWLAGKKNPIARVRENQCDFIVDISKTMFSKGNQEEKRRIVKQINSAFADKDRSDISRRLRALQKQKDGEEVLDCFAGIGYFTIPIAKLTDAKVWAIELNPDAVSLLKQNLQLNKVADKVQVILGDCKTEAPKLNKKFDRILMGWFPGTYQFLPTAIQVAKSRAVIHFHELAETAEEIEQKIEKLIADSSQLRAVQVINKRKVKGYGVRKWHWVLDLQRKSL